MLLRDVLMPRERGALLHYRNLITDPPPFFLGGGHGPAPSTGLGAHRILPSWRLLSSPSQDLEVSILSLDVVSLYWTSTQCASAL